MCGKPQTYLDHIFFIFRKHVSIFSCFTSGYKNTLVVICINYFLLSCNSMIKIPVFNFLWYLIYKWAFWSCTRILKSIVFIRNFITNIRILIPEYHCICFYCVLKLLKLHHRIYFSFKGHFFYFSFFLPNYLKELWLNQLLINIFLKFNDCSLCVFKKKLGLQFVKGLLT